MTTILLVAAVLAAIGATIVASLIVLAGLFGRVAPVPVRVRSGHPPRGWTPHIPGQGR